MAQFQSVFCPLPGTWFLFFSLFELSVGRYQMTSTLKPFVLISRGQSRLQFQLAFFLNPFQCLAFKLLDFSMFKQEMICSGMTAREPQYK